MSGIMSLPVADTPLVVVDLETTGLHPNGDSILEVGVVRIEPGSEPQLVLDTLVNPGRRVAGTEIHGITDQDVRGAPSFADVAPSVLAAMDGAVLAAYNVYFDTRFLKAELEAAGAPEFPPYLCLMYMRPLLDLGKRCSLADACEHHGLDVVGTHVAADDALLGAHLWKQYRGRMDEVGVTSFADLASRRSYKFFESFGSAPIRARAPRKLKTKSRRADGPVLRTSRADRLSEYWAALKAALADLALSSEELEYLRGKGSALGLETEELRWLHGRAFAGVLASVSDDEAITDDEVGLLHEVSVGLRELGWAPGDALAGAPTRGLFARIFGR